MYKPYENAQTVGDEAAVLADFSERSKRVYQQFTHDRDVSYGCRPRSTLDLFDLSGAQSTVVFLHGGYWQSGVKSDFACIVPPLLEQGCRCILLEYDLAPSSSLSDIVQQIDDALGFLQAQGWNDIVLIGHSAGAHLAACHMAHPVIGSAHLISGVYDLAPIRETHLNEALQLSDEEVLRYSPAYMPAKTTIPCHIIYGAKELPELKWQATNLFEHRQRVDLDNVLVCRQLPRCDHFNILDFYCSQLPSLLAAESKS